MKEGCNSKDVEEKWLRVRIQERKSHLASLKRNMSKLEQMIEDIKNGQMLDCEAQISMVEREIGFLESELESKRVIDVNPINEGGESNG